MTFLKKEILKERVNKGGYENIRFWKYHNEEMQKPTTHNNTAQKNLSDSGYKP